MYAKNVDKTLKNREKIEKNLIEKYDISMTDLAIFFEASLPSIRKDLKNLGIEASEYSEPEVVDILKDKRTKEITASLRKGMSEAEVLEMHGLWRMPADIEKASEEIRVPEDFAPERQALMRKVYVLAERGISSSELFKYYGITRVEREFLKIEGILDFSSKKNSETKDVSFDYVEMGEDTKDVSRLTGYPENILIKGVDYHEERKTKNPPKKSHAQKMAERREEVYRRLLAGEREETIAKSLGVTRVTIGNDVRTLKAEHMPEHKENGFEMYTRVRNTVGSEKRGITKSMENVAAKKVKSSDMKTASAGAQKAIGMGTQAFFGYGPQAGTTKTMTPTQHAKLVNEQHNNRAIHQQNPAAFKAAVMSGGYETYLKDRDLVSDEREI